MACFEAIASTRCVVHCISWMDAGKSATGMSTCESELVSVITRS